MRPITVRSETPLFMDRLQRSQAPAAIILCVPSPSVLSRGSISTKRVFNSNNNTLFALWPGLVLIVCVGESIIKVKACWARKGGRRPLGVRGVLLVVRVHRHCRWRRWGERERLQAIERE